MSTKLFVFLIVFQAYLVVQAQNTTEPVLLKRYFTYGGNINSRGWNATFRYGIQSDEKSATDFFTDFGRLKHEKEVRIVNASFNNPKQYVFGRINQTFVWRVGINRKMVLSDKLFNREVLVNFNLGTGFSGMVLKPVYLEIYKRSQDQNRDVYAVERYNPAIHTDQSVIYGNAAFTYGLDELKLKAGGFLKASFTFEWSNENDQFKSIETGIVADFYNNRIPIMAFSENHKTFISLYAGFNLGNRW